MNNTSLGSQKTLKHNLGTTTYRWTKKREMLNIADTIGACLSQQPVQLPYL